MRDRSESSRSADEPFAILQRLLRERSNEAISFGRALSTAFANGVTQGKRFSDVLKSFGLRLAETLPKAAFKPVELGRARSGTQTIALACLL